MLAVLRSDPYNLQFDVLIEVKARARNQFGYGDYSEPNVVGARIQVEPVKVGVITWGPLSSNS